jgi:SAM-dependent methyltransferase
VADLPVCIICGGDKLRFWAEASDVEYHTTSELFRYFHCPACDVLVIHPVPSDRLSEIYPANYYSFLSAKLTFAQRCKDLLDRRLFARILRAIPGNAVEVLDVGGGCGNVLNQVRRADARVAGTTIVDIDPGAQQAATRDGHRFFLGRFEEFSSQRHFDLILLLNIIEHVDNPAGMLSKVRELLTPGGVALIKTPNFDSLDARLFRHRSWGGYHCPRHWVLFNRTSFASVAERSGLKLLQVRYTQGAPFWAVSVIGILSRRGLVRTSRNSPAPAHPLVPALQVAFGIFDLARATVLRTSQMFIMVGRSA